MRVGLALVAAALFAGEGQAADQFDLVCKGEIRDVPQRPGKPAEQRYRIDLTKGEWCMETCAVVRHFAEVTSSRLTFESEESDLPRKVVFHWVDRATGAWVRLVDNRYWFKIEGTCERAPFSGFGAAAKF